jgi:hypothetical protein
LGFYSNSNDLGSRVLEGVSKAVAAMRLILIKIRRQK